MSPIDPDTFAQHARELIAGMNDHTTRGPLFIMDGDERQAVVIRGLAWAPRLHHFNNLPDGDLLCTPCGSTIPNPNPYNLGTAAEAANAHWRAAHMPASTHPDRPTMCRMPNPNGWDRCTLAPGHTGDHQSATGMFPDPLANP